MYEGSDDAESETTLGRIDTLFAIDIKEMCFLMTVSIIPFAGSRSKREISHLWKARRIAKKIMIFKKCASMCLCV